MTKNPPPPDLRLAGKERGLNGRTYPALLHGIDAAAVCFALWQHHVAPGLRTTIAGAMGMDEDTAVQVLAYWTGLHDVGKIDAFFQAHRLGLTIPDGYPPAEGRAHGHATLGCQWLSMVLPEMGYPTLDDEIPLTRLVAQLLGGHHGRYSESPEAQLDPRIDHRLPEDAWDRQRDAYLHCVRHVLDSPPPPPRLDAPTAFLVTGLVILADWLASQEHFLLDQLDSSPALTEPASTTVDALPAEAFVAHFERARKIAPGLITDAGLGPLTVPATNFAEAFPQIEDPFPLQASIAEHLPALAKGPGLLIVTAPTGEGKTETGLFAADHMGRATARPGRAVLLPTTATADSSHRRVKEYATRRADTKAPLTRLHSMAWLDPEPLPDTPGRTSRILSGHTPHGKGTTHPPTTGDDKDFLVPGAFDPTQWLTGNLRGILASWGIGTFDQGFMSVLPTRFNAVRFLGLAGKTVIVDEAHAVDPYMQGELEMLLRWLGRFEVPVILLSATLHRSVADAYARAYLDGAGIKKRPRPGRRRRGTTQNTRAVLVEKLTYPGWVYVTTDNGQPRVVPNPEPVRAQPRRPLTVSLEPVPVRAEPGPWKRKRRVADRREVLDRLLTPVLSHGGCVAVICTTVAEAQQTHDLVSELIDERDTELHLLHARFPQYQRDEITGAITHRFGKDGAKEKDRPRSAVVVATAIIEQSLDIDLDLMITDLAPVALLLQRAGRCWRHENLNRETSGLIERHGLTGPRLAVLVPEDPDADAVPSGWGAVHAPSLLERTHRLLRAHGPSIDVPGDVQYLVEQVHDDPTLALNVNREYERMAEELADRGEADRVTVDSPRDLETRGDLEGMTSVLFTDEQVATRLGADSVRVVCCFEDEQGRLWADPHREQPLPGTEPGREEPLGRTEAKAVMRLTVPVRGGRWYRDLTKKEREVPTLWHEWAPLKRLLLIRQPLTGTGRWEAALLGHRTWRLDPVKGLMYEQAG